MIVKPDAHRPRQPSRPKDRTRRTIEPHATQEYRGGDSNRSTDDIEAGIHAVGGVDVDHPRRVPHRSGASTRPEGGVGGRIVGSAVRLNLYDHGVMYTLSITHSQPSPDQVEGEIDDLTLEMATRERCL